MQAYRLWIRDAAASTATYNWQKDVVLTPEQVFGGAFTINDQITATAGKTYHWLLAPIVNAGVLAAVNTAGRTYVEGERVRLLNVAV